MSNMKTAYKAWNDDRKFTNRDFCYDELTDKIFSLEELCRYQSSIHVQR